MSTVAQTATLAWGYTMADVERFTGIAVASATSYASNLVDMDERRNVAWFAIVEILYDTETYPEYPTRAILIYAARSAVIQAFSTAKHHHGIDRRPQNRFETASRYSMYWADREGEEVKDFTDRIIDKMALPEVLGVLTDSEYEAISTLAAYGTQKAAAAALGVTRPTFNRRVQAARRSFMAAWLAPETPPARVNGNAEQCPSGHSRAEHGHRDATGQLVCRICNRNAGRRYMARNREKMREADRKRSAAKKAANQEPDAA